MKVRFQGRALTDVQGPLAKCYSIPPVCRPIDAIKTVVSSRTNFSKSLKRKRYSFSRRPCRPSQGWNGEEQILCLQPDLYSGQAPHYIKKVSVSLPASFFFSLAASAQNFPKPCAGTEFTISGELKKNLVMCFQSLRLVDWYRPNIPLCAAPGWDVRWGHSQTCKGV